MHVFISAYVFLALASWSALAAPFSGSERHNGNVAAQEDSSSPSILMSRQDFPVGFGTIVPTQQFDDGSIGMASTMDCDSKDKDKDKKKDSHNPGDNQPFPAGVNLTPLNPTAGANLTPVNPTATTTGVGPAPAVARRHFRSPMRRSGKDSPDIFERDDAPTTAASNPITVSDVLKYYLQQRAASRKRAMSPKTSRGHD